MSNQTRPLKQALVEEFENRFFKYDPTDNYHTAEMICGCVEGDLEGITENAVKEVLTHLRTALDTVEEEARREARIELKIDVDMGRIGYIGHVYSYFETKEECEKWQETMKNYAMSLSSQEDKHLTSSPQ